MLAYYQLNSSEQIAIFNQNKIIFIQENEFENVVCKMAVLFALASKC